MKTQKLSFGNIKDELSRDELKQIMAGSGGDGDCIPPCASHMIKCCCGGGKVNCVSTPQECCTYCGVPC